MSDYGLKRITALEEQTSVDSTAYTVIDDGGNSAKKYPLGSLVNSFADEFSTSKLYLIGAVVMYNGKLYKFVQNKPAGAWDSSRVEECVMGNTLSQPAISSQVKAGVVNNAFITPATQKEAVFYGLARAAGDVTQYVGSEPIGEYGNPARGAIWKMLGFDWLICPVEDSMYTSQAYSTGDLLLYNGYLYKALLDLPVNSSILSTTNFTKTTLAAELRNRG